MARVVHFDVPADAPERAMNFYRNVFGWSFHPFGPEADYWGCMTGDPAAPGINGGLMKRRGEGQPVTCTIEVESLETSMKSIEAEGGQIVVPPMPIPGMGRLAYFTDTEGNIFGIFEPRSEE